MEPDFTLTVGATKTGRPRPSRLVRLTEKSRSPLRMSPRASLPRNSGTIAPGWAAYQSRSRSWKRLRRKK